MVRVREEQLAEFAGDVWTPTILLLPLLAWAAIAANVPATLLLSTAWVGSGVVSWRRKRDPEPHLRRYVGPLARSIEKAGRLEPGEGEDEVAFRLRLVDTIDTLQPAPVNLGALGRGLGAAFAFMAALGSVGMLVGGTEVVPSAIFGMVFGLGFSLWTRRRQTREALALLETQLAELRAP
jgi:hypothetical protein